MLGLGALVEQQAARHKRRFNLLMLEEREYYFEDYGGFMHVADDSSASRKSGSTSFRHRQRVKGRLHVCSKSVVFDPDDASRNLTRIPLRDVAAITHRNNKEEDTDYFILHTRCSVEIPLNGAYIFHRHDLDHADSEFVISLSYVDTKPLLDFLCQLHGLYRLGNAARAAARSDIIAKREAGIPFESSNIVDIRERVLLPGGEAVLAQQVQPLLVNPGRMQITDARIYFQPFNHVTSDATLKIDIADIKRIYRRRFGMRDTAIEVFIPLKSPLGFSSSSSSSSVSSTSPLSQTSFYFNFSSRSLRDTVFSVICSSDRFAPPPALSLTKMTASWVKGDLSTFDYLLFLNQHAGRSFQDLTQYPVMPWVLQDYTSPTLDLNDPAVYRDLSKPIGALNPERLVMFQRRMREMPEEISHGQPFLYGTHYSSPGYVLYWLVRKTPQYMLKLQNGKFDNPDRLFNGMEASWQSVLNAPTDVKELIPEFFATDNDFSSVGVSGSSAGSFLSNSLELDLGNRQNGRMVDDVELPPWANGSPKRFIEIMRQGLENEHVSKQLHRWIDLIFGIKQRDLESNNVFYWLTYEGAVDLEQVTDPQERRSLELQLAEFGQCARQIFFKSHPQRYTQYDEQAEMEQEAARNGPVIDTTSPSSQIGAAAAARLPLSSPSPALPISSPSPASSTSLPLLTSLSASSSSPLSSSAARSATHRDALALLEKGSEALELAAEVSAIQTKELELDHELVTEVTQMDDLLSMPAPQRRESSWRSVWREMRGARWQLRDTLSLHRDTVTGLQFATSSDGENLVSVSADGQIKIYNVASSKLIRSAKVSDMTLTSCCVAPDGKHMYVACYDNHVYLYNQSYGRVVTSVQAHDDAVSCMDLRKDALRLLTGSWDTMVKLFGVTESGIDSRPMLELAEHETSVTAVAMEGAGNIAVSGAEDGGVVLWDLRTPDGMARQVEGFGSSVSSVCFSPYTSDFIVSGDGLLRHIDAGTGRALFEVETNNNANALRTDGCIAMGVDEEGEVRAWNLRGAELCMTTSTDSGCHSSLAVNADGSRFAVGGSKVLLYQR